ncbi:MAG: hypothetical protein KKE82_05215 [Proteobacteria bacterium]|nr:hypothetical protein [Pseudomonadota bacterium]MBU1546149.1 hypothetical protein [Pseudomonadota bacterium]
MVLLLWFWFFRPPHRSNPIPGTRGAFCRGVFILNPNFLTPVAIFCKEEEAFWLFFHADPGKEEIAGAVVWQEGRDARKKLDASGKKRKGPIFDSGNIFQEQVCQKQSVSFRLKRF